MSPKLEFNIKQTITVSDQTTGSEVKPPPALPQAPSVSPPSNVPTAAPVTPVAAAPEAKPTAEAKAATPETAMPEVPINKPEQPKAEEEAKKQRPGFEERTAKTIENLKAQGVPFEEWKPWIQKAVRRYTPEAVPTAEAEAVKPGKKKPAEAEAPKPESSTEEKKPAETEIPKPEKPPETEIPKPEKREEEKSAPEAVETKPAEAPELKPPAPEVPKAETAPEAPAPASEAPAPTPVSTAPSEAPKPPAPEPPKPEPPKPEASAPAPTLVPEAVPTAPSEAPKPEAPKPPSSAPPTPPEPPAPPEAVPTGGGGGMGGIAELGLALLAPEIEALIVVFDALFEVATMLDKAFTQMAEDASKYNAQVAQAQAKAEVRDIQAQMQRANTLGGSLSEYTEQKSTLGTEVQGIITNFSEPVIDMMKGLLEYVETLLAPVALIGELFSEFYKASKEFQESLGPTVKTGVDVLNALARGPLYWIGLAAKGWMGKEREQKTDLKMEEMYMWLNSPTHVKSSALSNFFLQSSTPEQRAKHLRTLRNQLRDDASPR